MSDPHLNWGHPEGRRVVALNVQHRTQDHSTPQYLLSEEGVVAKCTSSGGG